MLTIFNRKPKFNSTLYDIELKIETQQKQIDELRQLVLELSKQIRSLGYCLNVNKDIVIKKGL